jgi:hypothetical protein
VIVNLIGAWLDCTYRLKKHMFDLNGKCVHCGTKADSPTLGEVLRGVLYPKRGEGKKP